MHVEVDHETLQRLSERNEVLQQQVHQEQLQRCEWVGGYGVGVGGCGCVHVWMGGGVCV